MFIHIILFKNINKVRFISPYLLNFTDIYILSSNSFCTSLIILLAVVALLSSESSTTLTLSPSILTKFSQEQLSLILDSKVSSFEEFLLISFNSSNTSFFSLVLTSLLVSFSFKPLIFSLTSFSSSTF